MNIQELLFNPNPDPSGAKYLPLLIVFAIVILLAVGSKFVRGMFSKTARRYFIPFLSVGIVGLLNLFARYENLPWLGSGIVLLVVFLVFAVTIIVNVAWSVKNIPAMLKESKIEERYNKYLPKNKK